MQIVSVLRSGGLVLGLATAMIALPAFAQSQAPQQPAAQPQTGVYSGKEDAAAKASEGCVPLPGAAQAQTPEQLAQALKQPAPSPYDNKANGAAKDAMATCGGQ